MPEALQQAIKLYYTIVGRTYDREYGGYYEAFSREWNEIDDQRLSGKDANEKKSTNTNLHVVEAFANLYKVWPDENLKKQIQGLLRIFLQHIIDSANHHLRLFFDEQWNNKPALLSYGHDIEAAWLLPDCAVIINDKHLIAALTTSSVHLTNAAINGLDADGGLWYEYDLRENKLIREKHWWPQAEALVGFINAWQLRGENHYAEAALNCWQFIKTHLLNPTGEWYWGVNEDGSIMNEDKVGLWKCPYHNSRACLEIIRRLSF
jgi:mannobiose 2-epimerase